MEVRLYTCEACIRAWAGTSNLDTIYNQFPGNAFACSALMQERMLISSRDDLEMNLHTGSIRSIQQ